MRYKKIVEGRFISRPNRFVAYVDIDGVETAVHVKNTGRCKELLTEDAVVYLEDSMNDARKLRHSLVAVMKGDRLVNMDSQAPNMVAKEWLNSGDAHLDGLSNIEIVKGEQTFGKSRFDFYVKDDSGREGYLEVKGVTLENDGVVSFPDAPTERGVKHINELVEAKNRATMQAYCLLCRWMVSTCLLPTTSHIKPLEMLCARQRKVVWKSLQRPAK